MSTKPSTWITRFEHTSKVIGDYNVKRGEYKLIITGSSVEDVKFTFDRY